jgi:hypothetical protein
MEKSNTIKALTILSFVTLMTSFVAYKSGVFSNKDSENEEPVFYNGMIGQNESTPIDTPETTLQDTTRLNPAMLPTSKSAVFIDQKIKFQVTDTAKKDTSKHSPKK